MKRRVLSLLCALVLVAGALPMGAQAADSTYTVTANLYVPGELNKQLPGVTAYVTNPNNPLGVVPNNLPEGMTVESKAPTTPVSDNAKLTVGEDGSLTLYVPLPNPVFTIQQIDGCDNAEILSAPRDSETYSSGGDAFREGRVTSITLKLEDRSGEYVFSDCVEFPTLLGLDWTVPLTLSVDLSGIPESSGTTVPFDDVSASAYYYEPVYWAVGKGITAGTSAATFSPNANCTRAQIITFLWRASGSPEPESTVNHFSDVSADAYYAKACQWAYEAGIEAGSAFQPDSPCTRSMAVEFMWKQTGSPAYASPSTFTDVSSSAEYAQAVSWALDKGVTAGTSATTFSPDMTCTRAQIVTFLSRYLAG